MSDKKYRMEIPEEMLSLVHPDLAKMQGKIYNSVINADHLITVGWLKEIKEPLSWEEAWEECIKSFGESRMTTNAAWHQLGWNACLENQKIEVVVDDDMILVKRGVYEEDDYFLKSLFEQIGVNQKNNEQETMKYGLDLHSEKKEMVPITSRDLSFVFSEALKYARGIK